MADIKRRLDGRRATAGVVIPPDYADTLHGGVSAIVRKQAMRTLENSSGARSSPWCSWR